MTDRQRAIAGNNPCPCDTTGGCGADRLTEGGVEVDSPVPTETPDGCKARNDGPRDRRIDVDAAHRRHHRRKHQRDGE